MNDAVLSTRSLFNGWLSLVLVKMLLNGEEVERPVVEHPSGAALLAYDPGRRVAMTVRQTRQAVLYLNAPRLAEPVAGVIENESGEEAARRETLEELGLQLRTVELVGQVWLTPSSTTERVQLFLGSYNPADRVAPGGGAEGENEKLEVREEALTELWARAAQGEMMDAKLFMLIHALRVRNPELFAPAA